MKDPIDWQQIQERLNEAQAQAEPAGWLAPQAQKRILQERAHALARGVAQAEEAKEEIEFVGFQLNDERYGVESRLLAEVFPLGELTPLPAVPPFVAGLVNFRGQILTVLELRAVFGMRLEKGTEPHSVLVLQSGGVQTGLLATGFSGLERVARSALQASVPSLAGTRERYLLGVAPGRVALLDGARLLRDEQLKVHEEV